MAASLSVSAGKSGWMVVQSLAGIVLGYECTKLSTKFGINIPTDIQDQIIAGTSIVCISLVHGISHYVKCLIDDHN